MTNNEKLLERWAMAKVAHSFRDASATWQQVILADVTSADAAILAGQAEMMEATWADAVKASRRFSDAEINARLEVRHYAAMAAQYRLAAINLGVLETTDKVVTA